MRCVITGATGLLGGNLAIELASRGHEAPHQHRHAGLGVHAALHFFSQKAIEGLGYQISPLEPAIRDALTWFREHGMLS